MALFDKARGLVSQGIGAVQNAVTDPTVQNIAAAVPQGQIVNAIKPGTTDQMVQGAGDVANKIMPPGMDGMMQQAQNQMIPGMDGQMMAQDQAAMKDQLSNLIQMSGRVDSKIAMKSAKMFGSNEYRNQK